MANSIPAISVILPVFNARHTVGEAIESILRQTFSDFELIVVDDASTDNSAQIIQSYDDPRIVYLRNDVNLHVAETLNRGMSNSRGKYVARMDSDDISLPNRFAKQYEFLESHPEISICGTFAEIFGERTGRITLPIEPDELRCALIFDSCFAHPTVMFRRADFEKYNLTYNHLRYSEDFDLWQRAIGPLNGANIPEILLKYRVASTSVLRTSIRKEQLVQYRELDARTLSAFGVVPTDEQFECHQMIREITDQRFDLDKVEEWLIYLIICNEQTHSFPGESLKRYFSHLWYLANHFSSGFGVLKYPRYAKSPLKNSVKLTPALTARFLLRHR
jgi:glycosyltransferase involved in cell wall biosynthesis